jgi:flagellar biosynthesis protein FlhG
VSGEAGGLPVVRRRLVAVLSGKGGVGKTNVVASLAVAAARRGARVLLVDGDLGLANVDVLLGLTPSRSVGDVLSGGCDLEDAVVEGPCGVRILPATSGRSELAAVGGHRMATLVAGLWRAAAHHDLVLVDAGAGIGPSVLGLAAACVRGLLLTTPEPTSLADAYATLKVLGHHAPALRISLLVNGARDELEARRTHDRLDRLSRRFLERPLPWGDFLPHDPRVAAAVARQRAVVEAFPQAPWSRRLLGVADRLLRVDDVASGPAPGASATTASREPTLDRLVRRRSPSP